MSITNISSTKMTCRGLPSYAAAGHEAWRDERGQCITYAENRILGPNDQCITYMREIV